MVKDREAWHAAVLGIAKSWTQLSDWTTTAKLIRIFHLFLKTPMETLGFPGGSMVKNLPANAGDVGLIAGLRWSSGEGNGNPLLYFCLGNPMNRGAWWATVHTVAKSWTQLSNQTATISAKCPGERESRVTPAFWSEELKVCINWDEHAASCMEPWDFGNSNNINLMVWFWEIVQYPAQSSQMFSFFSREMVSGFH